MTEAFTALSIATLHEIYTAAEYKWELHGQWWPLRIGEHAHALDEAFPDAARFGMLTASNPGFLIRTDTENRAADLALQRELERLQLQHRPGFAVAQNRAWKAYNWLVIDPDEAIFDALGLQFGQIGTLFWPRGAAVRLRMRATRPETLAERPNIDWVGVAASSPIDAIDSISAIKAANP